MISSNQKQLANLATQSPPIYVLEVKNPKHPEGQPIAHILVERHETYVNNCAGADLMGGKIRLSYSRITAETAYERFWAQGYRGEFVGSHIESMNLVSLTSSDGQDGAVFLDLAGLKGHRIGTFLMNEIVQWAKQWPQAEVKPINLLASDASVANKERRNRFYEQFNIQFQYLDSQKKGGISKPMLAAELETTDAWTKNIRVLGLEDYLAESVLETERLRAEAAASAMGREYLAAERKDAEAHPFRWLLNLMWHRHGTTFLYLVFATVVLYPLWIFVRK